MRNVTIRCTQLNIGILGSVVNAEMLYSLGDHVNKSTFVTDIIY